MRTPASDVPPEVASFLGIFGPATWDRFHRGHTLAVLAIKKGTAPDSYGALVLISITNEIQYKAAVGKYWCARSNITKTEKGYVMSLLWYTNNTNTDTEVEYRMNAEGLTGVWNDPRGKDTISLPRAIMPKLGQKLVEAPR
jgi:hypothetical protein